MTPQESPPPRRRRAIVAVLKWIILSLVALVFLLLVSSFALHHAQGWLRVSDAIRELHPLFVTIHLVLLGLLWHRWAHLVYWAYRRRQLKKWQVRPLLGMRRRVCGLLLALEVVLVIRPHEWL